MNVHPTCHTECKYWKKYKENCPHFFKTTWTPSDGAQPYQINDCAPKRSVLLTMDLNSRLLGFQQACEEERNTQMNNIKLLLAHIDQVTSQLETVDVPKLTMEAEVLQIEDKDEDNHK